MHQFDDITRIALYQAAVLAQDADGNDVLAGLTLSETNFMIAYELPLALIPSADAALFLQLRGKFHAARSAAMLSCKSKSEDYLQSHRITAP